MERQLERSGGSGGGPCAVVEHKNRETRSNTASTTPDGRTEVWVRETVNQRRSSRTAFSRPRCRFLCHVLSLLAGGLPLGPIGGRDKAANPELGRNPATRRCHAGACACRSRWARAAAAPTAKRLTSDACLASWQLRGSFAPASWLRTATIAEVVGDSAQDGPSQQDAWGPVHAWKSKKCCVEPGGGPAQTHSASWALGCEEPIFCGVRREVCKKPHRHPPLPRGLPRGRPNGKR